MELNVPEKFLHCIKAKYTTLNINIKYCFNILNNFKEHISI